MRLAAAALLPLILAGPLAAMPPGDRHAPSRRDDCEPERAVSMLRDRVVYWARDAAPVALAAELRSEVPGDETRTVPWRLVITTLDRRVVDVRAGVAHLAGGAAVMSQTFDGRDANGLPLAAGTYVYRLEAPGFEGSGAFLRVYATDDVPDTADDAKTPLASSTNPSVPYAFYFGQQHAHTKYSDGGIAVASCTGSVSGVHAGATPTDAFAYAKASGGVDWFIVLEHNHLMDDACGSTCTAATIQGRYHDGLAAAASATTSSFVGIYGMEWGVINNGGHVALYDVTKLMSWESYAEVSTAEYDYGALWTAAANAANQGPNGAAGSFCHPTSTDYGNYTQNAAGLSLIRGSAVISGPAFSTSTTFADAGSRYAGPKASKDMYQFALQRGWKIGPEAHGDQHCWNYGNSTRNRTVVLANGLTKANVMDAIKSRRFYASSDQNAQMYFGTSDYLHAMGEILTSATATKSLVLWVNDPDGSAVSTVTLYDGDANSAAGTPATVAMTNTAQGTYTASVNVPATGQHYYYAYVTLANGAELWSAPVWISRSAGCSDTTAPSATVTAPTASSVSGTVTVSATATDNVGVTAMTLKIDGAQAATSASGAISYAWSTSALAAGSSHTIVATAMDACGNAGTSTTKTVTIAGATCTDTTKPAASVTAPANGATVSGTVSVTAAGTDNVAVTGMTLKVDGTQVATSASGALTYSWNTVGLAAGSSHTLVATASDACGNVGTSSTVTVTTPSGTTFTDPTGNPGFEGALPPAPWTESGTYEQIQTGTATAVDNASVPVHAGSKMAWMAGYDNASDVLKQNLAVPNVAGNLNLKFYRQVHTTDGTTTAYDNLYVEVWNSAGTSRLATLTTLTNKNAGTTWIRTTAGLLDTWKGKTIQIRFTATNDGSNPTDFFIDDVAITNP